MYCAQTTESVIMRPSPDILQYIEVMPFIGGGRQMGEG